MAPVPDRDPASLGAVASVRLVPAGTLSPVALVDSCLARIRALDGDLQAWVHVDEVGARAAVQQAEQEVKAGCLRGALHGIPLGIKDIIHVTGMPPRRLPFTPTCLPATPRTTPPEFEGPLRRASPIQRRPTSLPTARACSSARRSCHCSLPMTLS
jgi:Amidase